MSAVPDPPDVALNGVLGARVGLVEVAPVRALEFPSLDLRLTRTPPMRS